MIEVSSLHRPMPKASRWGRKGKSDFMGWPPSANEHSLAAHGPLRKLPEKSKG